MTIVATPATITEKYKASFNSNGGSQVDPIENIDKGKTITLPPAPTKVGYTFEGWNDGTKNYISGATYTMPEKNIIFAAKWTENTYIVSGTVKDNEDKAASGASVKIMKGSRQIGTKNVVTDVYGKFTISDVANGTYNLVVEKIGIIVTKEVAVNSEDYNFSGAIKLPGEKTNSIVDVKSETPDIVVGNLDKQFEDEVTDNNKGVTSQDNVILAEGGSVEIKLIAEKKDDTAANVSDINYSAKANGKTVGLYIDLSVEKTVIDINGEEVTTQSTKLVELPNLINVYIPLAEEFQGKSDYVVYRYHGSQVDMITTQANADGEEITLIDSGKTINLKVKKFSTYAIAFKIVKSDPILPPTPPSSNDDDNDDDNWKASTIKEVENKISVADSEGGKINITKDKKDISIIPDKGYVIGDLIIDGKSLGPSEKYRFTDKKDHKITPVFVKETALPYYMKDNKKIYIGFSDIVGNIYKTIIPKGVKLGFEENPKNFKDNTIAWAKSSIEFVTQREIFLGTSQDIFSPNESMTRAMFVTAIGRLYESSYGDISGLNSFSDVDKDAYYERYVGWANENKIIKGIGENEFAPNEKNHTRANGSYYAKLCQTTK